ncbi:MAG: Gfo/Idh/MocA family oxidoreductase [Prevotellaceae bacterium]|jgi:glycerol-3-phosphate cytidylyltransferase|nr:Gfo/Idh/MocA family oxidoreductase [Prevotellaceae bacterium]
MKKIITYGTFDLLHRGHENLLMRAKALGDYLVVGVTSEAYDGNRGKLNVAQSLVERIENVKRTNLADEIIVEEYEGQKVNDILKHGIDVFVIGSDWLGKFDYLKEYCEVVYLERTAGVSSTQLRNENQMVEIGVIGSGRIAHRFITEAKYVSGLDVKGVYNPKINSAQSFCEQHKLSFYSDDLDDFIQKVDAVYVASPHLTHVSYIAHCLSKGKHVLCEKPMALSAHDATAMFDLARSRSLVLIEAIKTAYCPAFVHLMAIIKSGAIGEVKDIEASFSKLMHGNVRELDVNQAGGSMTELSSYVLLPIVKILGAEFSSIQFFSHVENSVDIFTKGLIAYKNATASFKVGLGVKTEGNLVISGTKGYAYVPAPWWKTEYFELRYEDLNHTMKYFYKFNEDGLRYEINDFVYQIKNPLMQNYKLQNSETIAIASIIEKFRSNEHVHFFQ